MRLTNGSSSTPSWRGPPVAVTPTGVRRTPSARVRLLEGDGGTAISGRRGVYPYIRGQHQDSDDWAERSAVEWNYQSVLLVFKRSERYERGKAGIAESTAFWVFSIFGRTTIRTVALCCMRPQQYGLPHCRLVSADSPQWLIDRSRHLSPSRSPAAELDCNGRYPCYPCSSPRGYQSGLQVEDEERTHNRRQPHQVTFSMSCDWSSLSGD